MKGIVMSKTPLKPVEQSSAPVPTHGGVYEVKNGVLVPAAGGAPAAQILASPAIPASPATETDPSKAGES